MGQYRCQIIGRRADLLPRDWVVNTFYLDTDLSVGGVDEHALISDAVDLWRAISMPLGSRWAQVSGKIYNMADAEPREPAAFVDWTAAVQSRSDSAPGEVALCLSYFADRNLPHNRGRMYIGPFRSNIMADRPDATTRSALATLAEGLSGLGGADVQWVQHSQVLGDYKNVTDYFVDDEWDTVRARGLKPTTRTVGTVSG